MLVHLLHSIIAREPEQTTDMKIFIHVLGLVAACMAGSIKSSGSDNQGDSTGWQPSNSPAVDFSSHAVNTDFLAGLSKDYQALSHGHEALSGQTFEHDVPQNVQSFGHDASQGYDLSNHGQAKSFDIGGHSGLPSFTPSGHGFSGDSYLKAAHDFGNHDQGAYNAYAGDSGSQGGSYHGDTSSYGGEGDGGKAIEQGDESYRYSGGAGVNDGHTQAFILHDGGNEYGHGGQDSTFHDLGVQGFSGHGGHFGQGFDGGAGHAEPFSVGEHIDEQHPVEVPLYKHITVPVQKTVHVNVPKPILVGIPQPYPVKVPVNKPVAVPVGTEISIPIEKVVPYPVVKHVPYPVEKHVPFKVEKTVHVHVPQPYPVKIPIYKTIHHHKDH